MAFPKPEGRFAELLAQSSLAEAWTSMQNTMWRLKREYAGYKVVYPAGHVFYVDEYEDGFLLYATPPLEGTDTDAIGPYYVFTRVQLLSYFDMTKEVPEHEAPPHAKIDDLLEVKHAQLARGEDFDPFKAVEAIKRSKPHLDNADVNNPQ